MGWVTHQAPVVIWPNSQYCIFLWQQLGVPFDKNCFIFNSETNSYFCNCWTQLADLDHKGLKQRGAFSAFNSTLKLCSVYNNTLKLCSVSKPLCNSALLCRQRARRWMNCSCSAALPMFSPESNCGATWNEWKERFGSIFKKERKGKEQERKNCTWHWQL